MCVFRVRGRQGRQFFAPAPAICLVGIGELAFLKNFAGMKPRLKIVSSVVTTDLVCHPRFDRGSIFPVSRLHWNDKPIHAWSLLLLPVYFNQSFTQYLSYFTFWKLVNKLNIFWSLVICHSFLAVVDYFLFGCGLAGF